MRSFIFSKTYKMLSDSELEMWDFSPFGIFDMWEAEQVTGDPRNSLYLRKGLGCQKKWNFLLEQYAAYKNNTADRILKLWDDLELTDYIYGMYELYHVETLENAFNDIDRLILEKQYKDRK